MIRLGAALAAGVLFLAGCGADAGNEAGDDADDRSTPSPGHGGSEAPDPTALRDGERFLDVAMPAAYTPSAPYGTGTDDYRCFLLDPKLKEDAFLTGIDVKPGNADVVHHVILFRVPPDHLELARSADEGDPGEGWTCFGGSGLAEGPDAIDSAPWIGAWAPGGGEDVHADDVGIPLQRGSRIVMQVHYNLLAGDQPDRSEARLRLASGDADLAPLETVLLPAPVELPCRPGHKGTLCDRDAAIEDVVDRFGRAGRFAQYFPLLCGPTKPGPEQSCGRAAPYDFTIRAAAGHMHLLGRQITIEVSTGSTAESTRVLHIDDWNFDDQGAETVEPIAVEQGDQLTVTCRHSQVMRDRNPQLEGQPERYVVWGEGTSDEMCLGVLLVTRD